MPTASRTHYLWLVSVTIVLSASLAAQNVATPTEHPVDVSTCELSKSPAHLTERRSGFTHILAVDLKIPPYTILLVLMRLW